MIIDCHRRYTTAPAGCIRITSSALASCRSHPDCPGPQHRGAGALRARAQRYSSPRALSRSRI
jgi:hypothetical protein